MKISDIFEGSVKGIDIENQDRFDRGLPPLEYNSSVIKQLTPQHTWLFYIYHQYYHGTRTDNSSINARKNLLYALNKRLPYGYKKANGHNSNPTLVTDLTTIPRNSIEL